MFVSRDILFQEHMFLFTIKRSQSQSTNFLQCYIDTSGDAESGTSADHGSDHTLCTKDLSQDISTLVLPVDSLITI